MLEERAVSDGIYRVVPGTPREHHQRSTISGHMFHRRRPGGDLYEKKPSGDSSSSPPSAGRAECPRKRHPRLNATDYRRAVENLQSYCELLNVTPHRTFISVAGEGVTLICSSPKKRVCRGLEWDVDVERMNNKCKAVMNAHEELKKKKKRAKEESERSPKAGEGTCPSRDRQLLGDTLAWGVEMVPVWENVQRYGYWKARLPMEDEVRDLAEIWEEEDD